MLSYLGKAPSNLRGWLLSARRIPCTRTTSGRREKGGQGEQTSERTLSATPQTQTLGMSDGPEFSSLVFGNWAPSIVMEVCNNSREAYISLGNSASHRLLKKQRWTPGVRELGSLWVGPGFRGKPRLSPLTWTVSHPTWVCLKRHACWTGRELAAFRWHLDSLGTSMIQPKLCNGGTGWEAVFFDSV